MYSVSYYSLNNIVYQLFIWHLHYTVLRVIYKRGNIYRRIFMGYKEVWWHFILAIPASVGFGVSRTSWAQSTNIERWLLLSPHLTTMMALVLRKQSSYHRKEAELSLNPSSECLQRLYPFSAIPREDSRTWPRSSGSSPTFPDIRSGWVSPPCQAPDEETGNVKDDRLSEPWPCGRERVHCLSSPTRPLSGWMWTLVLGLGLLFITRWWRCFEQLYILCSEPYRLIPQFLVGEVVIWAPFHLQSSSPSAVGRKQAWQELNKLVECSNLTIFPLFQVQITSSSKS